MKLEKIIKISATLKCVSGLHIGGGDTEMHIGGIDNTVVKHPITHQPYIPGSSLKGKMRSLLEWRSGAVKEKPLTLTDYYQSGEDGTRNEKILQIVQLFGCGGSQTVTRAEAEKLGPTRLSFWDCSLSKDYVAQILDANMLFTEAKSENSINRITCEANPRQMERVPADAKFDFELTMKKLSGDGSELMETVLSAMKLLELDSLGGSGSRGYGKVCFENIEVDGQNIDDKFAKLDPFKG